MKPNNNIVTTALMLTLLAFTILFLLSKYGISFVYHSISIINPLDKYGWLIDKIQAECLNLTPAHEGQCIHYVIEKEIGFKYAACKDNINRITEGGCCRDWTMFLSRVYNKFGWKYIYISYAPDIKHIRLDVFKNDAYCNIDIGYIACFKYEYPSENVTHP